MSLQEILPKDQSRLAQAITKDSYDLSFITLPPKYDEKFIKKIANAKSVKVKLNGRQYYDTRTLKAEQIKSIKDTYEYYLALGGRFL